MLKKFKSKLLSLKLRLVGMTVQTPHSDCHSSNTKLMADYISGKLCHVFAYATPTAEQATIQSKKIMNATRLHDDIFKVQIFVSLHTGILAFSEFTKLDFVANFLVSADGNGTQCILDPKEPEIILYHHEFDSCFKVKLNHSASLCLRCFDYSSLMDNVSMNM